MRLINARLDRYATLNETGQLVRNLGLTRKLSWYRARRAAPRPEDQDHHPERVTRCPGTWPTLPSPSPPTAASSTPGPKPPARPLAPRRRFATGSRHSATPVVDLMRRAQGHLAETDLRDRRVAVAATPACRRNWPCSDQAQVLAHTRLDVVRELLRCCSIDIDVYAREPLDAAPGFGLFGDERFCGRAAAGI